MMEYQFKFKCNELLEREVKFDNNKPYIEQNLSYLFDKENIDVYRDLIFLSSLEGDVDIDHENIFFNQNKEIETSKTSINVCRKSYPISSNHPLSFIFRAIAGEFKLNVYKNLIRDIPIQFTPLRNAMGVDYIRELKFNHCNFFMSNYDDLHIARNIEDSALTDKRDIRRLKQTLLTAPYKNIETNNLYSLKRIYEKQLYSFEDVKPLSLYQEYSHIEIMDYIKNLTFQYNLNSLNGYLVDYIPKDLVYISLVALSNEIKSLKDNDSIFLRTSDNNLYSSNEVVVYRIKNNLMLPDNIAPLNNIKTFVMNENLLISHAVKEIFPYDESFNLTKIKGIKYEDYSTTLKPGSSDIISKDYTSTLYKGNKDLYSFNLESLYKGRTKYVNINNIYPFLSKGLKESNRFKLGKILYKGSRSFDKLNNLKPLSHFGRDFRHKVSESFVFKRKNFNIEKYNPITYCSKSKRPIGHRNPFFVHRKTYNVHTAEINLASMRKRVIQLYDKILDIQKYHDCNFFEQLRVHMDNTERLFSIAEKVEFLRNVERDIATHEDLVKLITTNRDIMLAMLGLDLNKTNIRDMDFNDDIIPFIKDDNKEFDLHDSLIGFDKDLKTFEKHSDWHRLDKGGKDFGTTKCIEISKGNNKSIKTGEELIPIDKELKNSDTLEQLTVNNSPKPIRFEELKTIQSVMRDIGETRADIISSLEVSKDIRTNEKIINLCKSLETLFVTSNNSIDKKEAVIGTNDEQIGKLGFTILKNIYEMPYMEDLVKDPIARDIITMEAPKGVTVDDGFIHDFARGVDELLLPSEDFDYSQFKKDIFDYETGKPIDPVKKIDDTTFIARYPVDHPISTGEDIGRKYLELDVYTLKHLIEVFYITWQNRIFEFGTMDLKTGIEKMLKYMEIYIEYRMPVNLQEKAWRCYQLFRWYGEATIIKNSTYKVTFKYKPWKSNLYTGTISCPHNLENVIINTGYVLENTANNAVVELQQEVKREGFIQCDIRLLSGEVNIFINDIKVKTLDRSLRVELPIEEGPLKVRFEFKGDMFKLGNIIIDNCEFDDIVTEYNFEPGKANLGADLITKRICNYFMVTEENFDSIKEGIQGALSLRDLSNRLLEYYEDHHKGKDKGKRLTVKRGML